MRNQQVCLPLSQVLTLNDYQIPVYQRNYDWGEPEIKQLIDDINDPANPAQSTGKQNYYIGSLVVYPRANYQVEHYEVLDGQQRFTTLTLLVCYLKYRLPKVFNNYTRLNLSFQSRPNAQTTLANIFTQLCINKARPYSSPKEFSALINTIDGENTQASMLNGLKVIDRVITNIFTAKNTEKLEAFASYLLEYVKILRISVPKNTDVTHYFEVMNNRGEQLEKHEIVKAGLLSALRGKTQDEAQAQQVVQTVWLACADMSRHVQASFKPEVRKQLFGATAEFFKPNSFADLFKAIAVKPECSSQTEGPDATKTVEKITDLSQALKSGQLSSGKHDDKETTNKSTDTERFVSVIDFSNFLMQVLRIYVKNQDGGTQDDVPLDDKKLIESFEKNINKSPQKAKDFVCTLLEVRYLFDRYIVKRDNQKDDEPWVLTRYKLGEKGTSHVNTFSQEDRVNQSCMMLLSAFHVSYPTHGRKNWLAATLYWLYKNNPNGEFNSTDYLDYLEQLAQAFMLHRYLTLQPQSYSEFIYQELSQLGRPSANIKSFLTYGDAPLFAFNYLDYLLWKDDKVVIKNKARFRFSTKNTVEHFSPQTPKANENLEAQTLHSFGNLCLLGGADNSSLSNDGPIQKAQIINNKRTDIAPPSLKLELMMQQANAWGSSAKEATTVITAHEAGMIDILLEGLKIKNQSQGVSHE